MTSLSLSLFVAGERWFACASYVAAAYELLAAALGGVLDWHRAVTDSVQRQVRDWRFVLDSELVYVSVPIWTIESSNALEHVSCGFLEHSPSSLATT